MDKIEVMPVEHATQTFTLSDSGEATLFTMSYDYEPLAGIDGSSFDQQSAMGFNGFIDSLESAAQARAATR